MKGKRIKLPVTNQELKDEHDQKGIPVIVLAEKYGCTTSVIYRRLVEKDKYSEVDLSNITGYEIVNLTEAMKITGLSRFILTKLVKNNDLPYKMVGNRYMFQLRDVYKIVGIDLETSGANELDEMDMLKENHQKSLNIENVVGELVKEMQVLKKSVMNENKESYDKEVVSALRVINDSQHKMNETILGIRDDQDKIKDELLSITNEVEKLRTKNNRVVKATKKQVDPLAKFGGK